MRIIDKKLKDVIKENSIEHLLEEDIPRMDTIFRECYVITEDGIDIIVVAPLYTEITMKYHMDGSFIGPESWSYAKEVGELIEWQ